MKLEWSHFALSDRDEIFDYLEADSPRAAIMMDDRISAFVALLIEFPERGRPGRIKGTRELIINQTPYLAAYRVIGDTAHILRILHGSRRWPDAMPD
ncbi:type II toxin-antitoxin system RelE/ParE family toxin [Methylocapsa sp. S129]|uniref:type II toxin-antitoxin system RelE/ParE family toxin n=1 Tax=Methylocapsa sp. S129 TaxID=1641869 RepID=UPI00131ED01F|nr:type II toxin-antitoxin system RelE/ParE family toxin [Methylocapsa sp. S129]